MVPLKYHLPFDSSPADTSERVCDGQRHKYIPAVQIPWIFAGLLRGIFGGWCSHVSCVQAAIPLPGVCKDTHREVHGNTIFWHMNLKCVDLYTWGHGPREVTWTWTQAPLFLFHRKAVCSNLEPGCGSRCAQKHTQTNTQTFSFLFLQSFSKNYFRAQHDNNQKEGPSHQGHFYNLVQCVYQLIGILKQTGMILRTVVRVPTLLIQGRLPYGAAISFSPTVTVLWKGISIPCCRWGKWSLGWLSNRFRVSQLGSVDSWFKHGFSWPQNPALHRSFWLIAFPCVSQNTALPTFICVFPSQVPK